MTVNGRKGVGRRISASGEIWAEAAGQLSGSRRLAGNGVCWVAS